MNENASTASAQIDVSRGKQHGKSPAFVWSKKTTSTIGLYFYHPLVNRRGAGREHRDGVKALRRLLDFGRAAAPVSDDIAAHGIVTVFQPQEPFLVESCLALSFLEALSYRWPVAEMYAELAVGWPESIDFTPMHEAHYMRAVCRRRANNPVPEVLTLGLRDLDRAIADLRKNSQDQNDPRFVFERGVYHFSLWEHVDLPNLAKNAGKQVSWDKTSPVGSPNYPTTDNYEKSLKLFDQARRMLVDLAGASRKPPARLFRQLLDIANARCYARIQGGQPDDRAYLFLLEHRKAIASCGWTEENVPIGHLDTLVWTMFWLRDRLPNSDWLVTGANHFAKRLSKLPKDQFPAKDMQLMWQHLAVVNDSLELGLKFTPGQNF